MSATDNKTKVSPIQMDFFEKVRVMKRIQAALLNSSSGKSWFETDFKPHGVRRLNDAVMAVLTDEKLMAEFNKRYEEWARINKLAGALLDLEEAGGQFDLQGQKPEVINEFTRLKTKRAEIRKKKAERAELES